MRTQIKTKSGLTGWQGRLQDEYHTFSEFDSCSETYGLAERLGFNSAREAWDANPLVQGSTNPADYCRVLESNELPVHAEVIVELQVDADDPKDNVPEWMILHAVEQAIQNIVEMGEANGFSHDFADRLSIGLVSVDVVKPCEFRTGPCPDENCGGSMDHDECSLCGDKWIEHKT